MARCTRRYGLEIHHRRRDGGNGLDTANKLCQSVSNPADETTEVFLDELPSMVDVFGNDTKRSHLLPFTTEHGVSPPQSGTIHFQTRRNRYG